MSDEIPDDILGEAVKIYTRYTAEGSCDSLIDLIAAALLSERTRAQSEERANILARVEGIDPLKHGTTIGLWKTICFAIRGIVQIAPLNTGISEETKAALLAIDKDTRWAP